ncbi:MAG: hypothetical protein N3G76_00775 [Candidatus Micrarchaeota archaeon]|nr:hypothetical protein [Candidatus Micrarchaeota archaeon]
MRFNTKKQVKTHASAVFLFVAALLFLANAPSAAITSGRLVFANSSNATLYFDTATATYVDTSLANPNVYVELCATHGTDLVGKFVSVYYRSGAINISIGLVPVKIIYVNALNCTVVDVDISVYRAFYPGILSIGISSTPQMNNPVFIDLTNRTGLLSGEYRYTDKSTSTNTIIHLEKIYYSGNNEITTDKPYLIVSLWNSSGFINSTLVNRTTDAVFPLTSYSFIKVNNLTARLYAPQCTVDPDCGQCQRCASGTCVPIPGCGDAEAPQKLYLSVSTTGYVGDPVVFTVKSRGAVKDATVRIYYSEGGSAVLVDTGKTDSEGKYTADAAALDKAGTYYAYASKGGFIRSDEEYFELEKAKLSVASSSEVYVRTEISATVADQRTGKPVEGAQVKLYSPSGAVVDTCTTSQEGRCVFSAGAVRSPGTYAIVAKKHFYDDGAAVVNVFLYPLTIEYPDSVYARQEFDMMAVSFGRPLEDVQIKIKDKPAYTTGKDGKVTGIVFSQPGDYEFTARKEDYQTFKGIIQVSWPPIIPLFPKEMYSKEKFVITATSPDKDCISGVRIVIGDGYIYNTSTIGEATVRVEVPNNYTIVMSKDGCEPYVGIIEIPERPPEKPYEKPIVEKKPPKSAAELISETIGFGALVKSGCEGFYVEGLPVVLCDLLWLLVVAMAAAAAYLGKTNMHKAAYFFVPIIAAIATLPVIGVLVAALVLSFAYRGWADERARIRALKEEAEKVSKELAAGKSVGEVLREEAGGKPPADKTSTPKNSSDVKNSGAGGAGVGSSKGQPPQQPQNQ